jgi:hypothetical protein
VDGQEIRKPLVAHNPVSTKKQKKLRALLREPAWRSVNGVFVFHDRIHKKPFKPAQFAQTARMSRAMQNEDFLANRLRT